MPVNRIFQIVVDLKQKRHALPESGFPDKSTPMSLEAFRARVAAYLKKHGISPTRFGKVVVNDSNFVFDLEHGRRPRVDTIEMVEAWMREHKCGAK